MRMENRWIALMALAVCLVLLPSAMAQGAGLGRISFPTSGPPEAQKHFLRGVLFLHSFEYRQAREEFQAARKLAPEFAMAFWGEAMTYNEPLWFAQDPQAAKALLVRLAQSVEERQRKAPTGRERAYLGAIEVLYGDGTKEERDFAYSEAMRRLHEAYPHDDEAAAFYALSLIGTCHRGRDFRVYMKAAAVVEDVFARNPEHPGALHYLIHCYDDPIHAPIGLRAARIYARVAAEAAHALHMPSHIFFALGMWEEGAKSNENAWQASKRTAARSREALDPGGFHALWWLQYAYLQQGRYEDGRRLLERARAEAGPDPAPLARFHLVQMAIACAIEAGQPYRSEDSTTGLDLPVRGADLFAAGLSALNEGKREQAAAALSDLRLLRGSKHRASGGMAHEGHMYAGDEQALEIMELELHALFSMADGESREAVDRMKQAVEIEDRMAFEFGPPSPPKPAHELFGEILLQLGQPRLARVQFELALLRAPNRALSLLGVARSSAELGDKPAAREAYAELGKIWRQADPEVKEALEASLARL